MNTNNISNLNNKAIWNKIIGLFMPTKKSEWKLFSVLILSVIIVKSLVFELFFVPTGSMEPTIVPGDLIFATKYNYGYSRYSIWPFSIPFPKENRLFRAEPKIGEIVMFRAPHKMGKTFVKRLIAKEGDKIQLSNGKLYINDTIVKKDFIKSFLNESSEICHKYKETLPNGTSYIIIENEDRGSANRNSPLFCVPKDHYFFLGDNRDDSSDSRFELGYVPSTNLVAKAHFIIFSMEKFLPPQNLHTERFFLNVNREIE